MLTATAFVFKHWAWHWPIVHLLTKTPNLTGTWVGKLKSDYIHDGETEPRGPIDAVLIVTQTAKAAPRSCQVTGGHFDYGSFYQASMADESYVLPISQISEIQDLGNGRHIVVLPRWLARKSGLLKYERKS